MARTKSAKSAPTPVIVTRDAADILVEALNTIVGISFVRDAWENKAPDNYGVVEMANQSTAIWADNKMVDQVFQLTVHLYVTGGSNEWIKKVQDKLATVTDWYNLPQHEFAYEINKNHWTWNVFIIGPMQWEEAVSNG